MFNYVHELLTCLVPHNIDYGIIVISAGAFGIPLCATPAAWLPHGFLLEVGANVPGRLSDGS